MAAVTAPPDVVTSVYRTTLDRVGIVTQLVNRGYAVIDGLLACTEHDLPALLTEARLAAGAPAPGEPSAPSAAGLSRRPVVEATGQDASVRRDLTHDVDPHDVVQLPLLAKAARTLQFLVGGAIDAFMPQTLYARERPQFAYYAGNGSFYQRHFDNPRNLPDGTDNLRRITILLYLNEGWKGSTHTDAGASAGAEAAAGAGTIGTDNVSPGFLDSPGGELRLLLRDPTAFEVKIAPMANRCVVFFSDLIEHEVLPSYGHRLAITVWLSECADPPTDETEALMRTFFVYRSRQVAEEHDAKT
jgi:hypothetical protein